LVLGPGPTGYPAVRAGVGDGSFKAWSPEGSHTAAARDIRPPARVMGTGYPPQHGGVGGPPGTAVYDKP